jgi:hypothetical protein
MLDASSKSFKQAVSKGLLSGLVARFREDFQEFKQVYRTQYRLGRFLIEMRQRQAQVQDEQLLGGFM